MRSVFFGGEEVAGGLYFSLTALGFITIPRQGGVLPGGARERYLRTPPLLVVLVSPLFGITLAVLLPLSGLIVLAIAFWRRVRRPSLGTPPQDTGLSGADTDVPLADAKQTTAAAADDGLADLGGEEDRGDQTKGDDVIR
ncbi:MAG: hypothetical protein ACYC4L_00280 [Chloroflexota bacterium]